MRESGKEKKYSDKEEHGCTVCATWYLHGRNSIFTDTGVESEYRCLRMLGCGGIECLPERSACACMQSVYWSSF